MGKKISATQVESALARVKDESSFIQHLLIDLLNWPIDPSVETVETISYDWSAAELKAEGLDKKIVDGQVRQLVLDGCPWGIFLVEFKHPDVFQTGRGMTVPLRKVLSGLVPKQRKSANLPSFRREHLLFICTYNFQNFRFVHFKDPGTSLKQPTLASFGWSPNDSVKTVCSYNLPNLAYLAVDTPLDDWIAAWTKAFDVERVTKKFYTDYKQLHERFKDAAQHVPHPNDRPWLASVVLNRLMFVYFLQRKGFIDHGNDRYLEEKLKFSKKEFGKNRFYDSFLSLLFFEGFAKPEGKRSKAAEQILGSVRYLNGGLFLEHPIEQAARKAGKPIDWPDDVFDEALKFFGSFSWNLNDVPGGEDNEINPDVLGYILEKYVNQKAFGAYYTRPEITSYLCERTIHRLVLDGINTRGPGIPGVPYRKFDSVPQLIKKLDDRLAVRLLDDVLPSMSLLDPACGSGAFLVAAMKTLIDIYAGIFAWIEFHGAAPLKTRLATIRKDHASLDYFIKWRIITDNLYGVDLMPEAVEIARLRLFLSLAASVNRADELEPLPNIDFNVMDGNSLIGLLHVDSKRVAANNKKGELGGLLFVQKTYDQVVADRDRQLETYRHTSAYGEDLSSLRDEIQKINATAQETLNEILLADFDTLKIKFEQATWDDKKNKAGKPIKRPLTPDDIARLRPFHWAFSFSKVMGRGGFDAIITNPPWEVFKPNGKEFFEAYSDVVTKKSMTIHDFEAEQEKLLKDKEIRPAWLNYLSTYPHQNAFFRAAPEYQHQTALANGKKTGSDLNLYKLFVERCFRLLREGGQCGIVIPSGIYTDLGAKGLREMLFDKTTIDALFCIENRKFVFEDVDIRFKFVVLSFARGGETTSFPAAFMRHEVSELEEFPTHGGVIVDLHLVRRISPDSLSLLEFKGPKDVEIASMFERHPPLGNANRQGRDIQFRRELHSRDDRAALRRSPEAGRLPLYEGRMIWHFDHNYADTKEWVDEKIARSRLGLNSASAEGEYQNYRIAYREIASNTNERGFVSTVLPKNVFTNHKLYSPKREGKLRSVDHLLISAIFNSYVFDYMVRQRTNATVSVFMIRQTPVPRVTAADAAFAPTVERSAKLICTTPEFDELAKDAGLNPPDHTAGITDPVGRAKLRAELDAMVAHLYGLTDEQFSHILETFPLVDPDVRQAALNEFTRMIETGEAATFNPELAKPVVAAIVDPAQEVRDQIASGESATLEFKSTARWNVKGNLADTKMERVIVKTVAAFLNTKGGTLIIGVEDDGKVYGLANDYKLCGNKGRDGFENWLMQTLMKDFGKDVSAQLQVEFHQMGTADEALPGSADVCVIKVAPSPKPRFAVEDSKEVFYVRTGNATNVLKMSEFMNYCKTRWPDAEDTATTP